MFNSKKKKEEKARQDEQKQTQMFLDEFKVLSNKYNLTFYARLKATDSGIVPVIQVGKNPD